MSIKENWVIWSLSAGDRIRPLRDLHEELDPKLPLWFTAGKEYVVESMHPVADPPFVKVKTDEGHVTRLCAEHIQADFSRV